MATILIGTLVLAVFVAILAHGIYKRRHSNGCAGCSCGCGCGGSCSEAKAAKKGE